MKDQLLTVKQAAAYLSVPVPTVYFYLKHKWQDTKIPKRIQGRWRLSANELAKEFALGDFQDPDNPLDISDEMDAIIFRLRREVKIIANGPDAWVARAWSATEKLVRADGDSMLQALKKLQLLLEVEEV